MTEINYKYYKTDNDYNIKVYENYKNDIINYINNIPKEDYTEILKKDKRTAIYNIFSQVRTNIIKWYEFKENSKILEIGANYGEITGELLNTGNNVTSVEFSKCKAEAISIRHNEKQNLEIICGNLRDIQFEKKYDYITLIGILEYYNNLGFSSPKELLIFLKNLLSENGKILIAIDNKFGAKYLAGTKKYDEDTPFNNFSLEKELELFGRNELYKILVGTEFEKITFFYPLPDYKLTHVIYSDRYLPKVNSQKALYNLYYSENDEILFNELNLVNEAIKDENFKNIANSFFVELANEDETTVKFVNYNNIRKDELKAVTKINLGYVEKQAYNNKSQTHICNIRDNIELLKKQGFNIYEKYIDSKIISPFIKYDTFDQFLYKLINENKIDEFYSEIDNWYKYIKERLTQVNNTNIIFLKYNVEISEEDLEKMTFIKEGFWDLIFQNIFYEEGKYIIFDQEWYEENIPFEFLIYRAIKNLFIFNKKIAYKINYEDLLEKYNLKRFINIFDCLEKNISERIDDDSIKEFYEQKTDRIITIEGIKEVYKKELLEIYIKHDNLWKQNQELKKELSEIYGKHDLLFEKNKDLKKELSEIYEKHDAIYFELEKLKKEFGIN